MCKGGGEGGVRGEGKKQGEMERSLINVSTSKFRSYILCRLEEHNEEIVVKHEGFALFSEIIIISADSNPVTVKDGRMDKWCFIAGAQSRVSFMFLA